MGNIVGGVVDSLTGRHGRRAETTAKDAAAIAARGQREALEYLKEREALPQQFREAALSRLGGIFGLPGGEGEAYPTQEQFIEQAMVSPLYQEIMGGLELGEEAVLRHAGATGGLRSGNVQADLFEYAPQLQRSALTQAYGQQQQDYQRQLAGLSGLANLPSMAPQIAGAISAPSQTTAQGLVAGTQARIAGEQQATQNIMKIAQMIMGGMMGGGAFSDIRAKKDISYIETKNGHNIYKWTWNEIGEALGLEGDAMGVMAHEVYEKCPDAISVKEGLLFVNYDQLNLGGVYYG